MTWPNWVDLIIVTLVLITCYHGFNRGGLTELLRCGGAVGVTAVAVTYWGAVVNVVQPWLGSHQVTTSWMVFWLVFLTLTLAGKWVITQVARVITWERVHWTMQGLGGLLGALRGLWWGGFVALALSSSGFGYLQDSVSLRSLFGPQLAALSQASLESLSQRLPGWQAPPQLIPPMKAAPS